MGNVKLGKGVSFERIRRITGYLVGSLNRWNDAKRAEERDRVKHNIGTNYSTIVLPEVSPDWGNVNDVQIFPDFCSNEECSPKLLERNYIEVYDILRSSDTTITLKAMGANGQWVTSVSVSASVFGRNDGSLNFTNKERIVFPPTQETIRVILLGLFIGEEFMLPCDLDVELTVDPSLSICLLPGDLKL